MSRIIDGVILGIIYSVVSFILSAILITAPKYDLNTGNFTEGGGFFLYGLLTALIGAAIYIVYEFFMLPYGGPDRRKMVMGIRRARRRHDGSWWAGDRRGPEAGRCPLGPRRPELDPGGGGARHGRVHASERSLAILDKPLHQCLHDKVAATVVVKTK